MGTNISLKELNLGRYKMREEDFRNLFHSIKKNKGLEKLELNYDTHMELPEELKRLFEEMMFENSTLLDCRFYLPGRPENERDPVFQMFQFYMTLNRLWKRYIIMKRERDKKNPAVITRIEGGDNNNNEEDERKKRFRMRLLLHLFMKKPVMRNTIIFHLLREYPDDLVNNNNNGNEQQQQHPLLLRISRSNLAKNKRKRTTDDDGDNESNDGTNDPDDNEGVIDLFDSDSDSDSDKGT